VKEALDFFGRYGVLEPAQTSAPKTGKKKTGKAKVYTVHQERISAIPGSDNLLQPEHPTCSNWSTINH
jgi:hypothetical protein